MKCVLVSICVSLVSLAGCDVQAPHSIAPDKVSAAAYPRNVAVQPELAMALAAGSPVVTGGTKDQPLSIQQPMRNKSEGHIEVQYQFIFTDERGKQVPGSGGWTNLTMEPKIERFMNGAALDTTAVDWKLTVRSAK